MKFDLSLPKSKKYSVKIEGITPYMQHRMDDSALENWEKKRNKVIENNPHKNEKSIADFRCYKNKKGKIYIPSNNLKSGLIEAGKLIRSKVGSSHRSMCGVVAAMFRIEENELPISQKYKIDKRSGVNSNNKARIIIIRPRWDKWSTKFNLIVDNESISDEMVLEILKMCGNYIGIGSFRPSKNGEFGRFCIKEFNVVQ